MSAQPTRDDPGSPWRTTVRGRFWSAILAARGTAYPGARLSDPADADELYAGTTLAGVRVEYAGGPGSVDLDERWIERLARESS